MPFRLPTKAASFPSPSPWRQRPPEISDTPLPDSSGVDPGDPDETGNGEQGSFDPPSDPPEDTSQEQSQDPPDDSSDDSSDDEQQDDQPQAGTSSINRSAGTMSFSFSPTQQDSLDDDTVKMLGDFITSPRNTADKQILVEVPRLSGENATVLTNAIIDAFAQNGVSQSAFSFVTYQTGSGDQSYNIRLSFSQTSNRK